MNENNISELVEKFLSGRATAEEEQRLLDWYRSADHTEIKVGIKSEQELNDIRQRIHKNLLAHVAKNNVPVIGRRKNYYRIAIAAVLIFLVAGAWFVFRNNNLSKPGNNNVTAKVNDIPAPTNTRAVITLGNGSKVYIDSAGNGTLAQESNVEVVKNADGEISYQLAGNGNKREEIQYNTLFNPRGSKVISLTLSDGTKVWLNSESSLKYPTAFNGNKREVQITGEAYFEVAHDAAKPFYVAKGNMQVQVLGTHFNVNAYDDENAIRITLLEGSVVVNNESSTIKIKPGEQAVAKNSLLSVNHSPNVDEVMAWKNGLFQMNNADVASIMREISRWYNVDVTYQGSVPTGHISGKVPRSTNLSSVLKVFEYSGIKLSIQDRKIIVKN